MATRTGAIGVIKMSGIVQHELNEILQHIPHRCHVVVIEHSDLNYDCSELSKGDIQSIQTRISQEPALREVMRTSSRDLPSSIHMIMENRHELQYKGTSKKTLGCKVEKRGIVQADRPEKLEESFAQRAGSLRGLIGFLHGVSATVSHVFIIRDTLHSSAEVEHRDQSDLKAQAVFFTSKTIDVLLQRSNSMMESSESLCLSDHSDGAEGHSEDLLHAEPREYIEDAATEVLVLAHPTDPALNAVSAEDRKAISQKPKRLFAIFDSLRRVSEVRAVPGVEAEPFRSVSIDTQKENIPAGAHSLRWVHPEEFDPLKDVYTGYFWL